MVRLPVFGIFNVRTAIDACDCTRGLYGHRKRVCTGSWLWEKNPLLHMGLEPASIQLLCSAFQSDAPPTDVVEVLLYVHRNRRLIRDGSPGRPPRLSHSSWALVPTELFPAPKSGKNVPHKLNDKVWTSLRRSEAYVGYIIADRLCPGAPTQKQIAAVITKHDLWRPKPHYRELAHGRRCPGPDRDQWW